MTLIFHFHFKPANYCQIVIPKRLYQWPFMEK